ncbi:hypothetical protein Q1695_011818 [Nippostrongylus brasiliensis]|nr:hypothetical protein Q1695_011818 [Nippostrongylus brasiliensis]
MTVTEVEIRDEASCIPAPVIGGLDGVRTSQLLLFALRRRLSVRSLASACPEQPPLGGVLRPFSKALDCSSIRSTMLIHHRSSQRSCAKVLVSEPFLSGRIPDS